MFVYAKLTKRRSTQVVADKSQLTKVRLLFKAYKYRLLLQSSSPYLNKHYCLKVLRMPIQRLHCCLSSSWDCNEAIKQKVSVLSFIPYYQDILIDQVKSASMTEERPPTTEEIQILRDHVNEHIKENGSGKWDHHSSCVMSIFQLFSFQADLFHPKDVERFLVEDDYVSRFFMHCTDMPTSATKDHVKNTVDMVVRSFKYRLERNIRGKFQWMNSLKKR